MSFCEVCLKGAWQDSRGQREILRNICEILLRIFYFPSEDGRGKIMLCCPDFTFSLK